MCVQCRRCTGCVQNTNRFRSASALSLLSRKSFCRNPNLGEVSQPDLRLSLLNLLDLSANKYAPIVNGGIKCYLLLYRVGWAHDPDICVLYNSSWTLDIEKSDHGTVCRMFHNRASYDAPRTLERNHDKDPPSAWIH